MSKYALSFTTQGNDNDTYYLAASVLGMVAAKNKSAGIGTGSSGFYETSAKFFQDLIDAAITGRYWETDPKCYATSKTALPTLFSSNAAKIAKSVSYSTAGGSIITEYLSNLEKWLTGNVSSTRLNQPVTQSIPYINYKISCMSETDYKDFVAAVIKAGNLTSYEQTNTPVLA